MSSVSLWNLRRRVGISHETPTFSLVPPEHGDLHSTRLEPLRPTGRPSCRLRTTPVAGRGNRRVTAVRVRLPRRNDVKPTPHPLSLHPDPFQDSPHARARPPASSPRVTAPALASNPRLTGA